MTTIMRYFTSICFAALPAVAVFLCFRPYRMRALAAMKLKSPARREICLCLFIASVFGIFGLTLRPDFIFEDSPGLWGNIRFLVERPSWDSNLSLIPFTVFKDYAEDLFKSPVYFILTVVNFLGNLAMFLPIGFFPALLFSGATLKRSAAIGLGMSAFIEAAQYFMMRNSAVDDVILNTAGAMVGFAIYKILSKKCSSFTDSFLCSEI